MIEMRYLTRERSPNEFETVLQYRQRVKVRRYNAREWRDDERIDAWSKWTDVPKVGVKNERED